MLMVELLEYSAIFQDHTTICLFNMHYDSFHSLHVTNNDQLKADKRKSKGRQESEAS